MLKRRRSKSATIADLNLRGGQESCVRLHYIQVLRFRVSFLTFFVVLGSVKSRVRVIKHPLVRFLLLVSRNNNAALAVVSSAATCIRGRRDLHNGHQAVMITGDIRLSDRTGNRRKANEQCGAFIYHASQMHPTLVCVPLISFIFSFT